MSFFNYDEDVPLSSKKLTRKFRVTRSIFFISVISFATGLFVTYFSIKAAEPTVINYRQKFEELYKKNKKDNLTEIYIDLAKGIIFNYPSYYKVDEGLYYPDEILGDSHLILRVFEGDTSFELLRYKVINNQTLLDFARKSAVFSYQNLREVSYNEIKLNGYDTVTGEFEVNAQQKQITGFEKGIVRKLIDEPIGFKGELVYIKHDNYIYVWKTGLIGKQGRESDFHFIVENFKFIF